MWFFKFLLLAYPFAFFGTVFLISACHFDQAESLLRLDCDLDYHRTKPTAKEECEARNCIWNKNVSEKIENDEIPSCFFNLTRIGYKLIDSQQKQFANRRLIFSDGDNETKLDLELLGSSKASAPTFQLFPRLTISFSSINRNILRFQIRPTNVTRYEVPIELNTLPSHQQRNNDIEHTAFLVEIGSDVNQFGFKVIRKDNQNVIWDSTFGGGLFYSDQFLQIATYLPTKFVYGMGENTHTKYLHNLNYKTWPLFAFDQPSDDLERNSYGVHPFMMLLDTKQGTADGLFFLNSNAMEYTLTPDPAVNFRTSGGILDFFLFVGSSPENVVQQYQSLIGLPMMPPFWGLGFQLSRYGYKNTFQVERVIERNRKQNIPMDVHHLDIDYMNVFDDFAYDHNKFSNLPRLINQTKQELDLKWTVIIDAAIQANNLNYTPFFDGYKKDIYVRWDRSIPMKDRKNPLNVSNDRDVFYGRVWPSGPSAFPDFFKNETKKWWLENLRAFHRELNFDGVWIDMNEPANFDNRYEVCPTKDCYMSHCPFNRYDFPQAKLKAVWVHNQTDRRLSYRTLCLLTRQGENDEYLHYDVHSLYALTEAFVTNRALADIIGRRSLILSRSSYVGAGKYTAHWTGDNTSKWSHLRRSVLQMLEFNLFGIPWVGADICGFQLNTTPELCLRWSQLGAFYPFSRNHNDIPNTVDQDPAVWIEYGHEEVTTAARASLRFRYLHLHYLYTLFYIAHTTGKTVIRPLLHEFPTDSQTYAIDEQFMVGPSIMVTPFLYKDQKQLKAYLPNATRWYDSNGKSDSLHGYIRINDHRELPPIFFRANSIIPVAIADEMTVIRNTKQIRKLPLRLAIYPNDDESSASGTLYWDDGEALDSVVAKKYNYYQFEMKKNVIRITSDYVGYREEKTVLEQIQIFSQFDRKNLKQFTLKWTYGGKHHETMANATDTNVTFCGIGINLASLKTQQQIEFVYSIVNF